MDRTSGGRPKQPFRKIKQRPHRDHQDYHHQRKWPSAAKNNAGSGSGGSSHPPQVKILAKSNKPSTAEPVPGTSSGGSTSVVIKSRPSVVPVLEKSILKLNATDRARESAVPDRAKLFDLEFRNGLFENPVAFQSNLFLDYVPGPENGTTSNTAAAGQSGTTAAPSGTGQTFCVVAAVGLDGTGKSSVLNGIAQNDVFPTRASVAAGDKNRANPLSHVTNGIDLHITAERVFLLDTQPLLSASVLDELINMDGYSSFNGRTMADAGMATAAAATGSASAAGRSAKHFFNSNLATPIFSSVVGFDIAETENFAFIYSLQMLTFLMTVCDHLVVVIDSLNLDAHLFKLLGTALMMVGDAVVSKANLIIYLNRATSGRRGGNGGGTLETLFQKAVRTVLGPAVSVDFIDGDQELLARTVVRPAHSRDLLFNDQSCTAINYHSELAWFQSIQCFWYSAIRESSLFSDYARHLP